jgi:hypothetical protein
MTRPARPAITATTNRARVQNNCLPRRAVSRTAFCSSCQPSQSSAKPFVMLRSVPIGMHPGGPTLGRACRALLTFSVPVRSRTSYHPRAPFQRRLDTTHFARMGTLVCGRRASASTCPCEFSDGTIISSQPAGQTGPAAGGEIASRLRRLYRFPSPRQAEAATLSTPSRRVRKNPERPSVKSPRNGAIAHARERTTRTVPETATETCQRAASERQFCCFETLLRQRGRPAAAARRNRLDHAHVDRPRARRTAATAEGRAVSCRIS